MCLYIFSNLKVRKNLHSENVGNSFETLITLISKSPGISRIYPPVLYYRMLCVLSNNNRVILLLLLDPIRYDHRNMQDHGWPHRSLKTTRDCIRPYRTIPNHKPRTVKDYTGPHKTIHDHTWPFRPVWANTLQDYT